MAITAKLTVQQQVEEYRARYAAPLVCIECGHLVLAYAGSTEEAVRQSYVCFGCRCRTSASGTKPRAVAANPALRQEGA